MNGDKEVQTQAVAIKTEQREIKYLLTSYPHRYILGK